MGPNLSRTAVVAISRDGKSAAGISDDGKSAVEDENWFADAARSLLPAKAGTALHYTTGVDERLCQRYAAGHTRPPGYFIRSLLRSEGGWQWLAALMDGAEPQWWADIQRARLDSELLRKLVDEITK